MGLFDFVNKTKPSAQNQQTPQGNSQNPATYQNDRLVQTPFSDIKYPLSPTEVNSSVPGIRQFQGPQTTPVLTQQPAAQVAPEVNVQQEYQNTQVPNMTQVPQDPNQLDSLDIASNQPISQPEVPNPQLNEQMNKIDEFMSYAQNNNTVPQSNESTQPATEPQLTNITQVPASDTFLNYSQPQDTALQNNEQSSESKPVLPDQLPPLPEQTVENNNALPVAEENSPEPVSPAVNTLATDQEISKMEDGMIIGTEIQNDTLPSVETAQVTESPQPEELNTQPSLQTANPDLISTDTAAEEVSTEAPPQEVAINNEIFNKIDEAVSSNETSELNDLPAAPITPEVQNITPVASELPPLDDNLNKTELPQVNSANVPEASEILPAVSAIETPDVANTDAFRVFKRIAFVGLNVEKANSSVADKINTLALNLSKRSDEIIIDSSKGYGERLLFSLKDSLTKDIKGVYLRPFYSDFSDESRSKFNIDNYSSVVFSNLDSKVKYLIKSADVFIIPETSGFSNIALLFTLLTNSFLYYGQHKPVILLGKEWDKVITTLKSVWQLNQTELGAFNICVTPEDAVALINKMDSEYSTKPSIEVRKVVDLRSESEEAHYFVNKQ